MDEGGSVDDLPPSLFEEAPWRGPEEEFLHWGCKQISSEGRGCGHLSLLGPSVVRGTRHWVAPMPVTLMDE
jgi:hypothetical protein